MTSLQRMRSGKAAIGPDGDPMELHHVLQTMDGPIAEITKTLHKAATRAIHINPSGEP